MLRNVYVGSGFCGRDSVAAILWNDDAVAWEMLWTLYESALRRIWMAVRRHSLLFEMHDLPVSALQQALSVACSSQSLRSNSLWLLLSAGFGVPSSDDMLSVV